MGVTEGYKQEESCSLDLECSPQKAHVLKAWSLLQQCSGRNFGEATPISSMDVMVCSECEGLEAEGGTGGGVPLKGVGPCGPFCLLCF